MPDYTIERVPLFPVYRITRTRDGATYDIQCDILADLVEGKMIFLAPNPSGAPANIEMPKSRPPGPYIAELKADAEEENGGFFRRYRRPDPAPTGGGLCSNRAPHTGYQCSEDAGHAPPCRTPAGSRF